MNRLLANQLRRIFGAASPVIADEAVDIAGACAAVRADDGAVAHVLERIGAFVEQVDAAYEQHERDTTLLRRSLELTSEELLAANERLQRELSARSHALETLRSALAGLVTASGLERTASAEDDIERLAAELAGLATERERLRAGLEEGEQRYRSLYDGIIDAVMVCEITPEGRFGHFIEVNEVACRRLGYTREELLALTPRDIDGSAASVDLNALSAEVVAGNSITVDKFHLAKDGRRIPVEVHAHAFQLFGKPAALALVRDITERIHAEEQLRLWPKVFEASREGIIITDSEQRILSVNQAVTEITGYRAEELIGKTPRLFASGRQGPDFYQQMWADLGTTGHWQGEMWDRRKNGEIHPKWLSISVVRNSRDEVTHYVGLFTDITERKANEERIHFLAYHDPLTALPNRRLLRDRFDLDIAHARRREAKVALLYLDLDRFKTINDSLGHPLGDKLLKAATARLKSCLRETDTISRLGGDEFVIVLSDRSSVENLSHILNKVLDRMSEPFGIDGHLLYTSSSIGISIFPDDGPDFDTLLQKADTALYQAKEGGRNTYRYFTHEMNAAALDRMQLESTLGGALEHGELALHYQTQVDLASGRVIGVEALLRWRNPEMGLVPPSRFIPVAEDSGLIVPIGAWVLREACRQAQAWREAGWTDLTMAVNLSAVQFKRGDLSGEVALALAESGLDPAGLELELTESIMIEGAEGVLAQVQRLKGMGVQLSIDDFGTGYSSLSYLKRFAVDRLKIDQSFVRGLPHDQDDVAIVRAVIQMAHSLNLLVIGEGVETEAQADFLRQAGCDLAQGYFFGRPKPDPMTATVLQLVA